MSSSRIEPVLFVSHGAGPSWFMDDFMPNGIGASITSSSELCGIFKQGMSRIYKSGEKPAAILVISAHWESSGDAVEVLTSDRLYYDYYGFPQHTYDIKYACPTSPQLVEDVINLVSAAGIKVRKAAEREGKGFDHGVFVPLKLLVPAADIPVVQLSLHPSLDPEFHLKLGEALRPLRHQRVLVIGSGQATHNSDILRTGASFPGSPLQPVKWAAEYQQWLDETVVGDLPIDQRRNRLKNWMKAPHAKKAHPREEHLIPLLVAAAAAGYDTKAEVIWEGWAAWSMSLTSYAWK